ncbi:MAG: DUF5670 family protein [Gemmatimonadota bacterium]|nr:DUF5670 family protein [Gemmatimonadota bacterium]
MDVGIIAAIVMLLMWAVGALVLQGPGWIHLFLTIGVSLLIYRIVVRGSPKDPVTRAPDRN